jgi:hypothetical protein
MSLREQYRALGVSLEHFVLNLNWKFIYQCGEQFPMVRYNSFDNQFVHWNVGPTIFKLDCFVNGSSFSCIICDGVVDIGFGDINCQQVFHFFVNLFNIPQTRCD